MRFEPSPMTVTGTSAGSRESNKARSSSSAGENSTSAGPPTRNQVTSASAAFATMRPRRSGIEARRSAARSDTPLGRLLGHSGELAGQGVGPLRDVAGAEADDVVAGPGEPAHEAGEVLGALERDGVAVAAALQALDQAVAVGARDRLLAGGVD